MGDSAFGAMVMVFALFIVPVILILVVYVIFFYILSSFLPSYIFYPLLLGSMGIIVFIMTRPW